VSYTLIANARVPSGPAGQRSGGETGCAPRPRSHVYFFGMAAPDVNAELDSVNGEPESTNAASSASKATLRSSQTTRVLVSRGLTEQSPTCERAQARRAGRSTPSARSPR